jgi:hypothetical protein
VGGDAALNGLRIGAGAAAEGARIGGAAAASAAQAGAQWAAGHKGDVISALQQGAAISKVAASWSAEHVSEAFTISREQLASVAAGALAVGVSVVDWIKVSHTHTHTHMRTRIEAAHHKTSFSTCHLTFRCAV